MKTPEYVKRWRTNHHEALAALANSLKPQGKTGLQLWRALRRVEAEITVKTCAYCNAEIGESALDHAIDAATARVAAILGGLPPGFFVNRDPRGYALKIAGSDDGSQPANPFNLARDMGGDQVLAPQINYNP